VLKAENAETYGNNEGNKANAQDPDEDVVRFLPMF
jgi:hypothetical protein